MQKGRWYPILRLHVEPVVEPPGHHAVALGGRDRRPEGGDRAGGGRVLRGGGGRGVAGHGVELVLAGGRGVVVTVCAGEGGAGDLGGAARLRLDKGGGGRRGGQARRAALLQLWGRGLCRV